MLGMFLIVSFLVLLGLVGLLFLVKLSRSYAIENFVYKRIIRIFKLRKPKSICDYLTPAEQVREYLATCRTMLSFFLAAFSALLVWWMALLLKWTARPDGVTSVPFVEFIMVSIALLLLLIIIGFAMIPLARVTKRVAGVAFKPEPLDIEKATLEATLNEKEANEGRE